MVKPKYRLYTPGPVDVPKEFLEEMASPLVYHREAAFSELLAAVTRGLQRVMMTRTPHLYVLTSSGTGAMEAAVANLVSPGDKTVVAIVGKFGERWRELVIRYGGYVDELARPYGESIPPEELERKLRTNDAARCVFTTLTETSTGALNDIRAMGDICYRLNRLLVVDAVAGLGPDELRMDDWRVSVVVGGAQKGFAIPPGLAFIAVSPQAWEQVERSRGCRYYFDLRQYMKFAEKGQTPWTPAISEFYALLRSLNRMNRKGMVAWWKERAAVAGALREAVRKSGLELFPQRPANALTVIKMPEGVDGTKIVEICKKKDKVLLANGQAELRGRIVRIGHLGPVSQAELLRVFRIFLRALRQTAGRKL
jgi:aspartate aminotransferase-like enzyme